MRRSVAAEPSALEGWPRATIAIRWGNNGDPGRKGETTPRSPGKRQELSRPRPNWNTAPRPDTGELHNRRTQAELGQPPGRHGQGGQVLSKHLGSPMHPTSIAGRGTGQHS